MNANVMKRVVGFAAAVFFAMAAQAQTKTAVVDLKKVFDGYWRTKQADTQLKERASDLEKARGGMVEDYKKANEDFKKILDGLNDPAASADEKEKRKKDAEKKQGEVRELETSIRTFDENSRKTILEMQKRMRDSVLRDIRGWSRRRPRRVAIRRCSIPLLNPSIRRRLWSTRACWVVLTIFLTAS